MNKKSISWMPLVVATMFIASIALVTMADEGPPSRPQQYYGNVIINEQPAPDGTPLSAWINGVKKANQTTVNGQYGIADAFIVEGTGGDAVVFKIYNVPVKTVVFPAESGGETILNLFLNDTEPPSDVHGLSVKDAKDGKLSLTWDAATDNLAISYYKIYRNGNFLINCTGLSYQDTGLTNGQSYSYQVSAVDIAGNEGDKSDPKSGTPTATSEEPGPGPSPGEITPPVDNPPVISDVSHQPATVTSIDNVTITAVVTDDNAITSVDLCWNDTMLHQKPMTLQTGNIYTATIGPFTAGIIVTYYIKAIDNAEQETTSDTYNFTTIITDETGPTISIISPLDGSVINNTTPVIQAVYYDPAGINTSSVKITVDDKDVTANAEISTTIVTYIPTISLSSDVHTVCVEVKDNVDNKANKTWLFIIKNPTTLNVTAGNITTGETKNISLKEYETILEELEFTAANNLTDVKINVKMLTEKPEGVTVPPGEIYIYLDIESNVNESDITNLTIKFKVEKTWIQNNSIDRSSVKLVRYHNNTWEELSTQITGEDETYIYYVAQTTGLSTFAVAGTEIPIVSINWAIIGAVILIILIVTGIIVYFIILPKYK